MNDTQRDADPLYANPAPGFRTHPQHVVALNAFAGTVTVHAGERVIARTSRALLVEETGHAPVHYIPFEDIDFTVLRPSAHVSRCPFKGKASYWSLVTGNPGAEHEIDNVMWAYEMPYDEVLELAGTGAFYGSKVTIAAGPA